eukprot:6609979-Lingulodinium_polyedra.AAC.1
MKPAGSRSSAGRAIQSTTIWQSLTMRAARSDCAMAQPHHSAAGLDCGSGQGTPPTTRLAGRPFAASA